MFLLIDATLNPLNQFGRTSRYFWFSFLPRFIFFTIINLAKTVLAGCIFPSKVEVEGGVFTSCMSSILIILIYTGYGYLSFYVCHSYWLRFGNYCLPFAYPFTFHTHMSSISLLFVPNKELLGQLIFKSCTTIMYREKLNLRWLFIFKRYAIFNTFCTM